MVKSGSSLYTQEAEANFVSSLELMPNSQPLPEGTALEAFLAYMMIQKKIETKALRLLDISSQEYGIAFKVCHTF